MSAPAPVDTSVRRSCQACALLCCGHNTNLKGHALPHLATRLPVQGYPREVLVTYVVGPYRGQQEQDTAWAAHGLAWHRHWVGKAALRQQKSVPECTLLQQLALLRGKSASGRGCQWAHWPGRGMFGAVPEQGCLPTCGWLQALRVHQQRLDNMLQQLLLLADSDMGCCVGTSAEWISFVSRLAGHWEATTRVCTNIMHNKYISLVKQLPCTSQFSLHRVQGNPMGPESATFAGQPHENSKKK